MCLDVGNEVVLECGFEGVCRCVPPIDASGGVVNVFGPTIDDVLAVLIGGEGHVGIGEIGSNGVGKIACTRSEGADVVDRSSKLGSVGVRQSEKGVDRVGHRDEGDFRILTDETGVWVTLCCGMDHFGCIIAGSA